MKYDIFISCKSEDYHLGGQVYEFLINHRSLNRNVFFADKTLNQEGNSDYGDEIDKALDSSTHLIIVSSNAEYLKKESSSYVYEEWHNFVEEIRSGRKKGEILTIFTDDVRMKEVPFAIRNRQSFPFTNFSSIIDYLTKNIENKKEEVKKPLKTIAPLSNTKVTPIVDETDDDLDYDDAIEFMKNGELQEAMYSLQASFENGNTKTIPQFNKLLFQNFGKIDWDEETWEFLEQQAEAGNSFAHLAFFYKYLHNKEEHQQAATYLKAAYNCDRQNGYITLCRGIAVEKGIGERPNLRRAMSRYEHAYNIGISEACSYVAEMYLNGSSGQAIDENKALEILENGCVNNDARSCYILGEFYARHIDVDGNFDKAKRYFNQAISNQMYEGWIALGKLIENNIYVNNRWEEALHCYFEAIKHGITDGHAYIAKLYWKQDRYEDAKIEAEIGEKNNNALSISILGSFYEEGIPDMDSLIILHKPDYPKAWHYYQKAYQIGGRIEDAISMSRLYVKEEYRPENITWDVIEEYLKEGSKIPITQAIELMVDALRLNKRDYEAISYIELGAKNGSLLMMYEYGIRNLSTGKGLNYLEESGKKGYIPSIKKLLEHYKQRRLKNEYESWLEIAHYYQVEVPIDDYAHYLYRSYPDRLWEFLSSQLPKKKTQTLYWMAYYVWRKLEPSSENIKWLLDELYQHLETIVTYKTRIYDIYADLLLQFSEEKMYQELISRVNKIDEIRGIYLALRKDIYSLDCCCDCSSSVFKQIQQHIDSPNLADEWKSRFRKLRLKALTIRMRVLIIGNQTITSDLLRTEWYYCIITQDYNDIEKYVNSYKPHLILNCSNIPIESFKLSNWITEIPIVDTLSIGHIRTESNSTYEENSFFEECLIKTIQNRLIISRTNELNVPPIDFSKCVVVNCEDEDNNWTLAELILRKRCIFRRARTGIEIITMCEEEKIDLILMDIVVPEINGLLATRIIKEVNTYIPIIGLSVYAYDENIREAMNAGMDGFLAKPWRVDDLIDIVKTTLESSHSVNYISKLIEDATI